MRRLPGYAFAFGGSSAPLFLLAFCHFSILPPSSDGPVRFALDSQRGALLSHSADATTDDTTVCKWIPEPAPSSSAPSTLAGPSTPASNAKRARADWTRVRVDTRHAPG